MGRPDPNLLALVRSLSAREAEIAQRLHLTNIEIADELDVSHNTVRAQVQHLLVKLGARTRTHAALLVAPLLPPVRLHDPRVARPRRATTPSSAHHPEE